MLRKVSFVVDIREYRHVETHIGEREGAYKRNTHENPE